MLRLAGRLWARLEARLPGWARTTRGRLLLAAAGLVLAGGAAAAGYLTLVAPRDAEPWDAWPEAADPGVGEPPAAVAPPRREPAAPPSDRARPDPTRLPGAAQQLGEFAHWRHEGIDCIRCHETTRSHGELVVRTKRACMDCHHVELPDAGCVACHRADELAWRRDWPTSVRLSVWDVARVRSLPFEHEAHATLDCAECHVRPPAFPVDRSCTSCHEQHHEPRLDCTACHVPAPEGTHERTAHVSCAGAGCHEALPLTPQARRQGRNVCLVCHQDLKTHEPDQACVACHVLPAPRD